MVKNNVAPHVGTESLALALDVVVGRAGRNHHAARPLEEAHVEGDVLYEAHLLEGQALLANVPQAVDLVPGVAVVGAALPARHQPVPVVRALVGPGLHGQLVVVQEAAGVVVVALVVAKEHGVHREAGALDCRSRVGQKVVWMLH